MTNTEPRDTPTASSGAIKVIVVSVAAIIVLLIVIKELDFTPSKVITPTVSVEFQSKNGGVAPPATDATARGTEELEKKVRQLEAELRARAGSEAPAASTNAPVVRPEPDSAQQSASTKPRPPRPIPAQQPVSTTPHPPAPSSAQQSVDTPPHLPVPKPTQQPASPTPRPPPPHASVAGVWRSPASNLQFTQVGNNVTMQVFVYGVLTAVGKGAVSGNSLQVNYVNNVGVPGRMTGVVAPDGSRIEATDYGRGYPQTIVFAR